MSGAFATYHDDSLLAALQQGDEGAFQELYERYWKKIFSFVYNRLHEREASEEIVQEVFFALWERREAIIVNTTISAYLYGVAKNKLLNTLRSHRIRQAYAADFSHFISNQYDNSNDDYQDLKSLEAAVEGSLSALPEKCRTVFRLSRQQHVSIPEISTTMNISKKTVENYLTQALHHLRTTLGDYIIVWIMVMASIAR